MDHVLVVLMAVTPQEDGGTIPASTSTSTITIMVDHMGLFTWDPNGLPQALLK